MAHLLARKRSVRSKNSESTSTTASDQKSREGKSAEYKHPNYAIILGTKGSFMDESDLGITDASQSLCRTLLEREPEVPQDSLFRDDLFHKTCQKVWDRNEAMVVQYITRLIVPSAEILAVYGATGLQHLTESVSEGWDSAIPVYGPRPEPDYSVGFGRSAFTGFQLEKLGPFVGELTHTYTSYFMGTWRMYFPFLTCEVKCGAQGLDVADRQNAHSMTLAVRGIVELFKHVGREKELHREILAFSVSHDDKSVRIYGHYPVIDGNKTTFYRHLIRMFNFIEFDGKEKWAAYKFTKNVYDIWMPTHFQRICSVVDELQPGLSHAVEGRHLTQQSNAHSASRGEHHSHSGAVGSPDTSTPNTSVSQGTGLGTFQKPNQKAKRVA
jgi:hypothetical protein